MRQRSKQASIRCSYMWRRVGGGDTTTTTTTTTISHIAPLCGLGKRRSGEGGDGAVFDYGLSFPHVNYYQCASGGRIAVAVADDVEDVAHGFLYLPLPAFVGVVVRHW
ncbi:hypothetical protein E2C01_080987 [Portunus trituberculatus]|uniref:Uncharacterized protein n=1 Tax=Portunus trituberculatus TaxID=210409 RepID=A0A5B7IL19_PORTR|nr:hypothetical protein [Portunus trituberculatus]